MNKKITIIGCVLLFMLVALPLVSAIAQDTDFEKKDSPLFRIRTRRAISEKISEIIVNIRTNFLGNRISFLQFQRLKNNPRENRFFGEELTKLQKICTNAVCN